MSYTRKAATLLSALMTALLTAACGQWISPLASPITRVVLPTPTLRAIPTNTSTPTLIPTITQTPTPGPSPTPDTRATSVSVYATITALAATPTYPPTSTPRPQRTPIGAGPEASSIPSTALVTIGGITVQTLSQQVYPGGAAALTIKTKPAAVCTVQIDRSTGDTTRLEPIPGQQGTRTVGRDGVAAWVWTVDAQEPAGIMRLVVDCGAAGKASLQIKVTR